MFKPSLLAASVAACASFTAIADTTLPTTTITASRLSSLPAGTAVYIIDQEAIKNSPAQTIADVLSSIAGISVRQLASGFNEPTIDLRGFGAAASSNTLILLNGRRLNDIDISGVDLSGIPLANIDHIEVLAGGGSVLYGDGASGGTINIITKQAKKNTGSIAIASGSNDSKDIQASGDIVSGSASVRLFARHAESDGYRDNSASRQDIFGLDGQLVHGQHTWFLSSQVSQSDNRLAGVRKVNPSTGVDELHNNPEGTATPNDYAEDSRYQVWAGWKLALNNNIELIVDGSKRYKTQQAFLGDYDYNTYHNYVDTRLITDSLTPRVLVNYKLGAINNSLRTGIDWYQTDYLSYRGVLKSTAPIHAVTIDSESRSLYVLQSSRLEQTTLTVGARKTKVQQSGADKFDTTAQGSSADDSEAPAVEQRFEQEMYEAGINQELGFGLTAMLNASRSVRFGTVDEVYEYDAEMRVFSPLLPQVGKNIEASLAYEHDIASVTATVYRQKLKNEIHFNPYTYTNDNLDPTKRTGLSLSTTIRLPMNVQINGSLTQQKAEFTQDPVAGNDVPVVAKHLASLGISLEPIKGWNIAITDTYTGSKRLDNDQTNDFDTKIPAYHRVDAKTSYRLANWQASLAILNVGDADDHYDYGIRAAAVGATNYNVYPLANREYRLALSYDF